MKNQSKRNSCIILFFFLSASIVFAQKTIKEYVGKTDREKIKKDIVVSAQPQTAGGYSDGHGVTPLLTSASQLPDTVALITFHIYDMGTSNQIKNVSITYYSLSEKGGNIMANSILNGSINQLKESFKKQGVVLLTPDEYLNTDEKRNYYYNTFMPQLSKLGKFLSGIETKHQDISVTADGYRAFDIAAASDFLRAESLGSDLAKKLEVDGVLSIAIELASDNKRINMNGAKMILHGPNPVPKEDKKYISQNMGAGYYAGQIYASGSMYFDKSIEIGKFENKKQSVSDNFEGIDVIFDCFVEKFHEKMKESIEKAAKKYSK